MSASVFAQQFCVRWNSHLGSLGAAFPQLLAGQRFVDVTLACEGHQVHCHRLVLAACSTYFESLLGGNPCKHPIIILPRDVKLWEIQALVDFMYKGEVNVSQAGLPDLLKSAEILQIRGLCGSEAAVNLNNQSKSNILTETLQVSSPSTATATATLSSVTSTVVLSPTILKSANLQTCLPTTSSLPHLSQSTTTPTNEITSASSTTSTLPENLNYTRENKLTVRNLVDTEVTIENDATPSTESASVLLHADHNFPITDKSLVKIETNNGYLSPNVTKTSLNRSANSSNTYSINTAKKQTVDSEKSTTHQPNSNNTLSDSSENNLKTGIIDSSRNEQNIKCEEIEDESEFTRNEAADEYQHSDDDDEDDMQGESSKMHEDLMMANVYNYDISKIPSCIMDSGCTPPGRRVRRSEALLRQAADCVSRGQTFQTVSDMFNIPISTIRFFMARKGILPRRKRGRATNGNILSNAHDSAVFSEILECGSGSGGCGSSGDGGGIDGYQEIGNQQIQGLRRSSSSSSSEPPFHVVNYKLPKLKQKKSELKQRQPLNTSHVTSESSLISSVMQ